MDELDAILDEAEAASERKESSGKGEKHEGTTKVSFAVRCTKKK